MSYSQLLLSLFRYIIPRLTQYLEKSYQMLPNVTKMLPHNYNLLYKLQQKVTFLPLFEDTYPYI